MAIEKPSNIVVCDICQRKFALTNSFLEEKKAVLEKEGLEPTEVVLTILTCPKCGKSYPVILDTEETTAIAEKLRKIVAKEYRLQSKGIRSDTKLIHKRQILQRKLTFKRQQLVGKFNGSFYQTEDGKEQLDYHYHV